MSNWLGYRKSGEHIFIPRGNDIPAHTTFIPNPLTEKLEINLDTELANLMSTANRLLGQLEGMSSLLPNTTAIESVFMYKEALLSCWIDELNAPLYNVFDASGKYQPQASAVHSYVSVMRHGLSKMETSPYKNSFLCEMHGKLLGMGANKDNGRFRKKQVFLANFLTNSDQYNPTAPKDIPAAMSDLEKFIQGKDNFDATIKAALTHYQFETIHPFMTGNGRIGRILSYMILSRMKIITRPILCLSQYLYYNKMEYIDRMESLRQIYEYEQWVKFFIQSVILAAADAHERIMKWLPFRDLYLKKLKGCGKSIKALDKSFELVEQHPIIDVNTLAEKSGISYNTAAATLRLFCDLGIVKQSNTLERNRDYANTEFLKCFVGDLLPKNNV